MKEKIVEPLNIQRKVPYADKFKALADEIALSLHASLQAGDIGDIEAAGRQALAAMLSLYSEGNLPDKQAFAFLKSLAERKTPDPVQKVEQTTQVDMRVMVGALISDNPDALQSALDRAARARADIVNRLSVESPLNLQPASLANADAPLSLAQESAPDGVALQLKEPDEVANLRQISCPTEQARSVENIRNGRSPTETSTDDWTKYRNVS